MIRSASNTFYCVALDYVYLTPGSEVRLHPTINPELLPRVSLARVIMKKALTHHGVVVYSLNGDRLQDVTEARKRSAPDRFFPKRSSSEPRRVEAHRVEVGNPLFTYLLGPEWFGIESGNRWMPKRATVWLSGPVHAGDTLVLEGQRPDPQLLPGTLHPIVQVDGVKLPASSIDDTEVEFRRLFKIPAANRRAGFGRNQHLA